MERLKKITKVTSIFIVIILMTLGCVFSADQITLRTIVNRPSIKMGWFRTANPAGIETYDGQDLGCVPGSNPMAASTVLFSNATLDVPFFDWTDLEAAIYAKTGDVIKVTLSGNAYGHGCIIINETNAPGSPASVIGRSRAFFGVDEFLEAKTPMEACDPLNQYLKNWKPFCIEGFWRVNRDGIHRFRPMYYTQDVQGANVAVSNFSTSSATTIPCPWIVLRGGGIIWAEIVNSQI